MKRIRTITLAVAIMTCSAGNAIAEEFEFYAPNIDDKLNTMFESKMNELVKKTYEHTGHTQVVEYSPCINNNPKAVMKEGFSNDVEENRS